MELTFLGTSSGTPTRQRNVSGLAIRMDNSKGWYLVDCGEGTQHRLLHTGYTLPSLTAICITHVHGDHCFGLPGLLASASMAGRQDKLAVIGPRELESFVCTALSVTDSHLSYEIEFVDVMQLEGGWRTGDVLVERWPLSHRVPSYAYSFTETRIERRLDKEKLLARGVPPGPEWGQLQQGQTVQTADGGVLMPDDFTLRTRSPRKVVVGGDNDSPSLLATACEKANLLIHEATYSQAVAEKVGDAPRHSSSAAVARFAEDIGIENLILTHFSARYHGRTDTGVPGIAELEREARTFYRGNLNMADDLESFRVEKDGRVLSVGR